MWCACMCIRVFACVWEHMCVGACGGQRLTSNIFLHCSPPYSLSQGFSFELRMGYSSLLHGSPVSGSQALGYGWATTPTQRFYGCWWSALQSSRLCAKPLPIDPSLQSWRLTSYATRVVHQHITSFSNQNDSWMEEEITTTSTTDPWTVS